MLVRMTSNLFHHSRMHGVLIPGGGELVELPEDAAEALIEAKHAEVFEPEEVEPEAAPTEEPEAPEAPAHEPMTTADMAPETAEAEVVENAAAPARRGKPGRPRKPVTE